MTRFLSKVFDLLLGLFILLTVAGSAGLVVLLVVEKYSVMHPMDKLLTDDTPPPSYLLIRGERWIVDPVHDLSVYTDTPYAKALTVCDRRIIFYQQDLKSPALRDFIWHETMHAELCGKENKNSNWEDSIDTEEHDVIYPLSMAQISFMHDNPLFMKWMGNW